MANRLRVSLLSVPGTAGRLHLSPCPGRWDGDAGAASVAGDLAAIRAAGAGRLVTLVEAKELPLPLLAWIEAVEAAGLDFLHLPIADYGVPGGDFEPDWAAADLAGRLRAGETVAIHCRAGLGRTGTIAARLLIECAGLDAAAAIRLIRAEHAAEAVETAGQVAWLDEVARRHSR